MDRAAGTQVPTRVNGRRSGRGRRRRIGGSGSDAATVGDVDPLHRWQRRDDDGRWRRLEIPSQELRIPGTTRSPRRSSDGGAGAVDPVGEETRQEEPAGTSWARVPASVARRSGAQRCCAKPRRPRRRFKSGISLVLAILESLVTMEFLVVVF